MACHHRHHQAYLNLGLIHLHHKLSKNIYSIDESKGLSSLIVATYYYLFHFSKFTNFSYLVILDSIEVLLLEKFNLLITTIAYFKKL